MTSGNTQGSRKKSTTRPLVGRDQALHPLTLARSRIAESRTRLRGRGPHPAAESLRLSGRCFRRRSILVLPGLAVLADKDQEDDPADDWDQPDEDPPPR